MTDLFSLVGWDLEAEVRKIAQETGQDAGLLRGIAKSVAAGSAAGAQISQPQTSPGPGTPAPASWPVLATWSVASVTQDAAGTSFTIQSAKINASQTGVYVNALAYIGAIGEWTSIASVAAKAGVTLPTPPAGYIAP